jgi:FAD synthase
MENGKWKMKNEYVQIEFLEYLRENRKFESLKALKAQIKKDINTAKNYAFPTMDLN